MSAHAFDPNCEDCRPTLLDLNGNLVPRHDPRMRAISAVWEGSSPEEQIAFHMTTVHNSRDSRELDLVQGLLERMRAALEAAAN